MDFREAVQRLSDRPTRTSLAEALAVSYHSVRQALLPTTSAAARNPPRGWRETVARLARQESERLAGLAEEIESES
jgi:hypothetical protein